MISKLSFTQVLKGIIELVESKTELKCYDDVPKNSPMPCYQAEFVGQEPTPAKTMWIEEYYVNIHAYAKGGSSVHIFNAIQKLEEAMTVGINLPQGYELSKQEPEGLQAIMTEEDGSKHAVLGYKLEIVYGYKFK